MIREIGSSRQEWQFVTAVVHLGQRHEHDVPVSCVPKKVEHDLASIRRTLFIVIVGSIVCVVVQADGGILVARPAQIRAWTSARRQNHSRLPPAQASHIIVDSQQFSMHC
jgi:hypothetical protein